MARGALVRWFSHGREAVGTPGAGVSGAGVSVARSAGQTAPPGAWSWNGGFGRCVGPFMHE